MNNITDTQLIFLDNLIYLDLSQIQGNSINTEDRTVSEVITYMLDNIDLFVPNEADPPAAMTKQQWIDLLTSFKNNPANEEFLKNYKVTNYVTNDLDTNGFRAACFVNVNDVTDVAAIFRGTYGGNEWEDDFLMANDVWSEEMD